MEREADPYPGWTSRCSEWRSSPAGTGRCGTASRTKAAVERDYRWLGDAVVQHYHGDNAHLRLLKAAVEAFEGMGVEAFGAEVRGWLSTASHPVEWARHVAAASPA